MKLHAGGYLTFYLPGKKSPLEIRLDNRLSLRDVLDQLEVPISEIQLVSLNGVQSDLDEITVSDADEVHILAAVDGG